MSEDTLNVDSDEELSTVEEVGTEEAASKETTVESTGDVVPTGKEKALRDTEAALAERKAEFTRMSQQLAELKGQLTTLTALQQQNQKQEEVKDWLESIEGDKVLEDPASAMKALVQNLRKEIASVLDSRDAYLLSKAGAPKLDAELQAKVEELKADPELADLPEAKLAAMAKRMVVPKKAVMQPRGNIAGSARAPGAAPKKEGELTPAQIQYLKAVGLIKDNKRDDTLE
jgi:TolA-binding protein